MHQDPKLKTIMSPFVCMNTEQWLGWHRHLPVVQAISGSSQGLFSDGSQNAPVLRLSRQTNWPMLLQSVRVYYCLLGFCGDAYKHKCVCLCPFVFGFAVFVRTFVCVFVCFSMCESMFGNRRSSLTFDA